MRKTVKLEKVWLIVCLVLLPVAGLIGSKASNRLTATTDYTATELKNLHQSSLNLLFGEFRVSLSDILWIKGDEYIHQGIVYKEVTPREWTATMKQLEKAGIQPHHGEIHGEHEHGEEHEHHNEMEHGETIEHEHTEDEAMVHKAMGYDEQHKYAVPAIPYKYQDFRGILGDVERAVKPYSTQHLAHSGFKDLIPWYRIVTYINPHHIRAYITGAYFIHTYGHQPQEALTFLLEGERNNPDNPEIKEAIGSFYFYKLKDPGKAIPYLKQAVKLFGQLEKKPLNIDQEQSYRDAVLNVVLANLELKNIAEAEHYLKLGLSVFPQDKPLKKAQQRLDHAKTEL